MLHGQLKLGVQQFSGLGFVILNKYMSIYLLYLYIYIHTLKSCLTVHQI